MASNDSKISFIGIGRIRDQTTLGSVFNWIQSAERNQIESSFKSYLLDASTRFAAGSREKRNYPGGTMYLLADRELCCLYAVAIKAGNYPERHAFALLTEVIDCVNKNLEGRSLNSLEAGILTRQLKKPLRDLIDRYDNPANFDKTAEVQGKVDNVKGVMSDNIRKVMENHENIEKLEEKTDNLNQQAAQFNRSAGDLRRLMWMRKMKVTILLVLVGLAIVAYIGLSIYSLVKS